MNLKNRIRAAAITALSSGVLIWAAAAAEATRKWN